MKNKVAIDVAHVKLARWLAQTHPELFKAVLAKAVKPVPTSGKPMAGISDLFSGIGSDIASVANYLTSSGGLNTLGSLATSYFTLQGQQANANAQQAVLQTQLARAQAGQAPLPITYTTQPAVTSSGVGYTAQVPVLQMAPGQLSTVTPQLLAANTPAGFLGQYGLWIMLGAGALVLYFILRRS